MATNAAAVPNKQSLKMENHSQHLPFSHDTYLEYPALLPSQGSLSKLYSGLRFIIHTLLDWFSPVWRTYCLHVVEDHRELLRLYWKQCTPQFFAVQAGTRKTCHFPHLCLDRETQRVGFSCLNTDLRWHFRCVLAGLQLPLQGTAVFCRCYILYGRPVWILWLPWGHL